MTQNHLDQWLADEKAILERLEKGPGPGVARMDQIAGLTGLELMQGVLDGTLPYAAIAKTLDFVMVEVGKGRAVFQGTPGRSCSTPWARCTAAGLPRCWIRRWAAPCTP